MLTGRKIFSLKRRTAGAAKRSLVAQAGFTLLELMVVIAIMLVLLGMAAGRYEKAVQRAREATLHQDLTTMRDAIQQFTLDKQAAPQSLDDLVSAGYLREVPTDPITQRKDWNVETSDLLLSPDQSSTGVTDVHSASNAVSPFETTAYSTW
jgi:general secretion pathway protein G